MWFKELRNGFVVAECLAQYYPNTISMHSFDFGISEAAKGNNWKLILKVRLVRVDQNAFGARITSTPPLISRFLFASWP